MSKFATIYLPTGMSTIRKAVADWDVTSLRNEAHSLKGSCGFVGAVRMMDMCSRLMNFCGLGLIGDDVSSSSDSSQPIVEQMLSQMEAEYELVKLFFANKHSVHIPEQPKEASAGYVRNVLQSVSSLHFLLVERNAFT